MDMDFNHLIGNNPRNSKDLYHFVPQLAEPKDAPGVQLAPVLAIQVTLFPNNGISVGFTNHHVAGDGATILGFIRAWASLNKFSGDEQFLANEFIPFYDRSVIKDPHGQAMSIWDEMQKFKLEMCDIVTPPDKVRVTCAYVWTCLIKSEDAIREEIEENVTEFLGCVADCRSRLNPPLPQSYFGNCLVTLVARASHVDLAGKEGFTIAVELIGETIQKRMKDENYILTGEWFKEFCSVDIKRSLTIAGSTKLNFYAVDFGWGKPEKLEFVSIDNGDGVSMSLSKSKDSKGDLEVGLSLPKTRMNAFAAMFSHGLSFL